MRVTSASLATAKAVARAYLDILDREYALQYFTWRITREELPRPVYHDIGSAQRIEKAIDDALTA